MEFQDLSINLDKEGLKSDRKTNRLTHKWPSQKQDAPPKRLLTRLAQSHHASHAVRKPVSCKILRYIVVTSHKHIIFWKQD